MKVAIALCLMCVVVGSLAQTAGRPGAGPGAASSGMSSDTMRDMMLTRMLASGGAGAQGNLANMLLLRGSLEPHEYIMCRQNAMMCMMFMNR